MDSNGLLICQLKYHDQKGSKKADIMTVLQLQIEKLHAVDFMPLHSKGFGRPPRSMCAGKSTDVPSERKHPDQGKREARRVWATGTQVKWNYITQNYC